MTVPSPLSTTRVVISSCVQSFLEYRLCFNCCLGKYTITYFLRPRIVRLPCWRLSSTLSVEDCVTAVVRDSVPFSLFTQVFVYYQSERLTAVADSGVGPSVHPSSSPLPRSLPPSLPTYLPSLTLFISRRHSERAAMQRLGKQMAVGLYVVKNAFALRLEEQIYTRTRESTRSRFLSVKYPQHFYLMSTTAVCASVQRQTQKY